MTKYGVTLPAPRSPILRKEQSFQQLIVCLLAIAWPVTATDVEFLYIHSASCSGRGPGGDVNALKRKGFRATGIALAFYSLPKRSVTVFRYRWWIQTGFRRQKKNNHNKKRGSRSNNNNDICIRYPASQLPLSKQKSRERLAPPLAPRGFLLTDHASPGRHFTATAKSNRSNARRTTTMKAAIGHAMVALSLAACNAAERPPEAGDVDPAVYRSAVGDPSRPAADRERDALRKPAAVLEFFGIRPGMTVLEMYSGGGYYAEILSKVVGGEGRVDRKSVV